MQIHLTVVFKMLYSLNVEMTKNVPQKIWRRLQFCTESLAELFMILFMQLQLFLPVCFISEQGFAMQLYFL